VVVAGARWGRHRLLAVSRDVAHMRRGWAPLPLLSTSPRRRTPVVIPSLAPAIPPCEQWLAAVGRMLGPCYRVRRFRAAGMVGAVSGDVGLTLRVSHCTGLQAPSWGHSNPKRAPHIPFGRGGGAGYVARVIVAERSN
jgi:hypothetical protein